MVGLLATNGAFVGNKRSTKRRFNSTKRRFDATKWRFGLLLLDFRKRLFCFGNRKMDIKIFFLTFAASKTNKKMDEMTPQNPEMGENQPIIKEEENPCEQITPSKEAIAIAELKKKMRLWRNGFIIVFVVLVVAHILVIELGKSSSKTSEQPVPKAAKAIQNGGLKIAYINTDSIMANYQYAKEMEAGLKSYQQQVEGELRATAQRLQTDYEDYMKNGEKLTLTKQKEKEKELTERQQRFPALQQEMATKMQERQLKDNKKLVDAIYAFVDEYNKTHDKFNLILRKEYINSPVLYADETMDITNEIIKGLNEEYAKVKAK
jgi:outer membrane protein